ncbi:hypothetical protein DL98DRAFT_578508 [Cadophora sp. DSE1049]|nr:hypothetical protein DL98DRAFT_578508 [Cadophora sp. DSE1049]
MTSLIERANAADRVIDAPFNLAHAGADEFFAWMTDAVDAPATSDIESGMSGFDGDIADDTSTSWLFWISLNEDLWFENEMEIASTIGVANTMNVSYFVQGTPQPLDAEAINLDSPSCLPADTKHPGTAPSPAQVDEATSHDPSPTTGTSCSFAAKAADQDSPSYFVPISCTRSRISFTASQGPTTPGASGTVIIIDDSEDDLAIGTPSYIRKIVGSNILDDGTGSDYGDEGVDDLQQRSFSRVSRRRGRINQLRDTQVGVTITACTLFLIAECCTQGRNSQRK